MRLYLIFGLLMMMGSGSSYLEENAILEIKISEVKNDDGYILISLFNNENGFPEQSNKAFKSKRIKAAVMPTKVIFENIPQGTYAVAVFHDENNNGKLDKNVVGIPSEGYGSSNNPKKLFRAPNFDECKFKVENSRVTSTINLNY